MSLGVSRLDMARPRRRGGQPPQPQRHRQAAHRRRPAPGRLHQPPGAGGADGHHHRGGCLARSGRRGARASRAPRGEAWWTQQPRFPARTAARKQKAASSTNGAVASGQEDADQSEQQAQAAGQQPQGTRPPRTKLLDGVIVIPPMLVPTRDHHARTHPIHRHTQRRLLDASARSAPLTDLLIAGGVITQLGEPGLPAPPDARVFSTRAACCCTPASSTATPTAAPTWPRPRTTAGRWNCCSMVHRAGRQPDARAQGLNTTLGAVEMLQKVCTTATTSPSDSRWSRWTS